MTDQNRIEGLERELEMQAQMYTSLIEEVHRLRKEIETEKAFRVSQVEQAMRIAQRRSSLPTSLTIEDSHD